MKNSMQRARRPLTLVLASLALVLIPSTGFTRNLDAGSVAFEKAHAAAQDRSQKGDWEGARKLWLELLREHAGADHARPHLPEIREALRRAAFWSKHRRPDPKQLIEGKLLNYSRTTGKLRISYESGQLADFDSVANYHLHPVHFTGSYTVEVEGSAESLTALALLVGMETNNGYVVQAGDRVEGNNLYRKHVLARLLGSKSETLDDAEPRERKPSKRARRVRMKISVGKSTIRVTYDGRSILTCNKSTSGLGQFGMIKPATFDKITLDGPVGISWIEDRVDAAVQDDLKAFEATYKDPPELAAWEAGPVVKKSSRNLSELASRLPFPEKVTQAQRDVIARVRGMIGAQQYDRVVTTLAAQSDTQCSPATVEFLLVINWLAADRYSLALDHIHALERLSPITPELRIVEAILNTRVERRERAIVLLQAIIAEQPGDPAMFAELAQQLLLDGQLDASRKQIDAGLALAPGDADLHDLRRQVAKASQGPSWSRAQQAAGEYFEVASDIDPRTTRVIAREADQAIQHFVQRFEPLPAGRPKLKLYVFSGSASYANYIAGVEAASPENTVGVFSPRLKQVLLWNQADRPATLRVVRHEVMHSYADAILGATPTWLSEGNAEYFAVAKQADGRWKEGADAPLHLLALKTYGLQKITLEKLLYMNHSTFMANAKYTYPMSWALVDFLLNSTPANRALFEELWKTLRGQIDATSAVHAVFDEVDLPKLEDEFWASVKQRIGS